MVKVRSLDHTRFVITGTGTTEKARTLYYAGGRRVGTSMGDWSTDLGGAKVYNDLDVARTDMKSLCLRHGETTRYLSQTDTFITFDIKLVDRKKIMVARLKYDGETL